MWVELFTISFRRVQRFYAGCDLGRNHNYNLCVRNRYAVHFDLSSECMHDSVFQFRQTSGLVTHWLSERYVSELNEVWTIHEWESCGLQFEPCSYWLATLRYWSANLESCVRWEVSIWRALAAQELHGVRCGSVMPVNNYVPQLLWYSCYTNSLANISRFALGCTGADRRDDGLSFFIARGEIHKMPASFFPFHIFRSKN